jgi:hypothetical protein
MNPLELIDAEIAKLQSAREVLARLFGGAAPAAAVVIPPPCC